VSTAITHFIVAGSFSTFAPSEVPRLRLVLLLGALSVVPDFDVIGFRYGIEYGDPLGHRGFTHSIVFALMAGVAAPVIAFPRVAFLTRTWWVLALLAFMATISHGVLDSFTDAGLGVGFLIPFDDTRYFAPWRPLATSPLSVSAFINGPGLRILGNELVWVGIPLILLSLTVRSLRRLRRRTGRRTADQGRSL
jgi:inner membrane protein